MITKIETSWNENFQNDGALYFFQRIVEMLEFNTIDIYQCPIMNTHRLIIEYVSSCKNGVKSFHLNDIYDEFLQSFQTDVAIIHGLGEEKLGEIVDKLKSSPNNRMEIMDYLLHSVGNNYMLWIKSYILEIVPLNKNKKKIEKAVRCLLPELFLCGYSRNEIYYSAKTILLSASYDNNKLKKFLKSFNRKEKTFSVYLAINEDLMKFKSILADHLELSFDDDGNFSKFENWDNFFIVKMSSVKALDAGVAAYKAYNNISLFTSFYQFFDNYSDVLVSPKTVVTANGIDWRTVYVNYGKFKIKRSDDQAFSGQLSESFINSLTDHARCSLSTIRKILKLHNRAISNNGQENGFLNFWSILELVCVKNESSKLNQVKSIVVPILQYDYLVNLFSDLEENLKSILSEDDYNNLCDAVTTTDPNYLKIANIVLLDEYYEKLDSLVDSLIDYPVIRSRLLELHDNYKSTNTLFNMSARYAKRVDWHLSRIYRARNSIVHSGTSPVNLNELGIHLHSYVDSLVNEVIFKLSTSSFCHVSNVLIDSELKHDRIFRLLKENRPFDYDIIKKTLCDNDNYCPNS